MKPLACAILALVALAHSACMAAKDKQGKKLDAILEMAHEQAREMLKDPESARFSHEYIVKTKGSNFVNVCGLLNAKNSFGGYGGSIRYVTTILLDDSGAPLAPAGALMDDTHEVPPLGVTRFEESPFDKIVWNERCVDATHDPMLTQPKTN